MDNIRLYPWFKFFQNLLFWQAVWFLYFQDQLSAAQAILLYVIYDVATTVLEVPSGFLSDRLGRRLTLIAASVASVAGAALLTVGHSFAAFAAAQILLGAGAAFASGTDSALLYETLEAEGRAEEVEAQELRAWRFNFSALALSAITGGVMARLDSNLPFLAGTVALLGMLIISLWFREPPHAPRRVAQGGEWLEVKQLKAAFTQPVLIWIFALSVLMYGFSHVPFVFGQPYIEQALAGTPFASEAPVVSGTVTALMMGLSVLVSLGAGALRQSIGLGAILLLAFFIQIALCAILAASGSAWAIVVLLLRMVPNSLSQPFIAARIQPLLAHETRATFLSLKSLCGRLLFSISLLFASVASSAKSQMLLGEVRMVLLSYALVGCVCLIVLSLGLKSAKLEH